MGPNHMDDGEWYALKTLRPDVLARSHRVRELFVREAMTWVGLWPHVNIVPAHFVTEVNDLPVIVLSYARHGNLRDVLAHRERAPLVVGLTFGRDVASGLEALPTPDPDFLRPFPVMHRDLKPENVLIGDHGFVMLTDFGLSKVVQVDDDFTGVGSLLAADERGEPRRDGGGVERYQTRRG